MDMKPSRVRYYVLAAGLALALLTYIHRQSLVRDGMPDLKKDLHFSKQQAGYLTASFLIAYGLFQVPWGLLGDRIGARHVLTILVLGWTVMMAATAFLAFLPVDSNWAFGILLSLLFLFGVFQAGGFPVWARVVADWMPLSQRATAQGAVWMFSRLGGAINAYIYLWLFSGIGTWSGFHAWSPLFLVLATLGLVWAGFFWLWFRNKPSKMASVNSAERQIIEAGREKEALRAAPAKLKVPWSTLLRSANVWGLCLMYGFGGFGGYFTTTMIAVYLSDVLKVEEETRAVMTSLPLAFGVVSCFAGGILSDWVSRYWGNRKWGRRCNGAIGLTLAGVCIMLVPWAKPLWLIAILISFSFFCNDLNLGPAWAACADVGGRYAGTISGAMNMMGQLFGAVAMAIAGTLFDRGQTTLPFVIFGCAYGLAALCWVLVDATKPIQTEDFGEPGA